jgi:hypothetical protein
MKRDMSVVGVAVLFTVAGAAGVWAQERVHHAVERESAVARAESAAPVAQPSFAAPPVALPQTEARPAWSPPEVRFSGEQHARPSGGSSGGTAVPRSGGSVSGGSRGGSVSSSGRSWSGSGGQGGQAQPRPVGPYSRPRDGRYATGAAVPRGSVPPNHVYPPHWNGSWWYPYYPYGYGAWGLGWYYYDPWFWGGYYPGYYGGGYYGYAYDLGSIRLKVKPRDAEVFVDGYYVGIVDEFDGTFQQIRVEEGPHVIQIRKEGFRPLEFKVRVLIDHTVTLHGELQPGELPDAP